MDDGIRSIGLRGRALAGGLVLLAVIAVIAAVLLNAVSVASEATAVTRRSNDRVDAVNLLQNNVLDLETGLRGYSITGDSEFLTPFRAALRSAPVNTRRLRILARTDPTSLALAQQVAAAIRDYTTTYAPAALRAAAAGGGRDQRSVREGKRRIDVIRALFEQLNTRARELAARRRAEEAHANSRLQDLGVVALIVLSVAVLLMVGFTVRAGRRVERLTATSRLLGRGDLDARAPSGGPAELGELGRAFNRMADTIQSNTGQLERLNASNVALVDSIYDQSPLGLAVIDHELRLARTNAALDERAGAAAGTIAGRRLDEAMPWLDELRPQLEAALAGESDGAARRRVSVPASRGEACDDAIWDVSWFPIRQSAGTTVGAGLVVDDVTERERAISERQALREADLRSARRGAGLERLSSALSGALTGDDVRDAIVRETAEALNASVASLGELDPHTGLVSLRERRGFSDEMVAEFARPIPLGRPIPMHDALRDGTVIIVADDAELERRYPESTRFVRERGITGTITIPLLDPSGNAVAAIGLGLREPPTGDYADPAYLSAIGARCSLAYQRARLFDREHAIAAILQRALLPATLPALEGIELGARFQSAGDGVLVGGDFYDVVALGERALVACLGDVSGKGPQAAGLASLARHAFRLATERLSTPAALLTDLNREIRRHREPGAPEFLTAVCVTAEPLGCNLKLLIAGAGHPGPILLRADGRVEAPTLDGALLGVLEDTTHRESLLVLSRGDTLVLYTDGMLDAQAPTRIDDQQTIAALVEGHRGTLDELLDLLVAHTRDGSQEPRDDVALLALRYAPA